MGSERGVRREQFSGKREKRDRTKFGDSPATLPVVLRLLQHLHQLGLHFPKYEVTPSLGPSSYQSQKWKVGATSLGDRGRFKEPHLLTPCG